MACDLVICIAHDPHEQLLRRFPPRTNAKIQATVGTLRVCRKILNSLRFLLRSLFTCASSQQAGCGVGTERMGHSKPLRCQKPFWRGILIQSPTLLAWRISFRVPVRIDSADPITSTVVTLPHRDESPTPWNRLLTSCH